MADGKKQYGSTHRKMQSSTFFNCRTSEADYIARSILNNVLNDSVTDSTDIAFDLVNEIVHLKVHRNDSAVKYARGRETY